MGYLIRFWNNNLLIKYSIKLVRTGKQSVFDYLKAMALEIHIKFGAVPLSYMLFFGTGNTVQLQMSLANCPAPVLRHGVHVPGLDLGASDVLTPAGRGVRQSVVFGPLPCCLHPVSTSQTESCAASLASHP